MQPTDYLLCFVSIEQCSSLIRLHFHWFYTALSFYLGLFCGFSNILSIILIQIPINGRTFQLISLYYKINVLLHRFGSNSFLVIWIKRESGENPEQTRCCKFQQNDVPSLPLYITGRPYIGNESEDLPRHITHRFRE